MSIATVVTRGFGTFGTAAEVVTRGYTIGSAILVTVDYHDGEPEKRKRYRKKRERQRAEIERIYEEAINGPLPIAEAAELAVRPFVDSEAAIPDLRTMDWEGFIRNMEAVERIQTIALQLKAIRDDEDDIEIILMLQ